MPIETIPSQSTPLLPAISTQGFLDVEGGHHVWWSRGGPIQGLPVCIVHGGPGGRSRLESAQWFMPSAAQWFMLDQRGCGKSTPTAELSANTLSDLVCDMEALRITQGIEQWALCGGSWGALVALQYAISYPKSVLGLLFRSPFLGTPKEINQFFERMPAWLCDEGRRETDIRSGTTGQKVLQKLAHLLHGDIRQAGAAARLWDAFETDMASPAGKQCNARDAWLVNQKKMQSLDAVESTEHKNAVQKFRIQAHYLLQQCFLEASWPQQLQAGWVSLQQLPVEIVHGDSDVVCPAESAQTLLRIFPKAVVSWVSSVGHDMRAPPMHEALTQAATRLVSRIASSPN
jgi:proline iminopeptidase